MTYPIAAVSCPVVSSESGSAVGVGISARCFASILCPSAAVEPQSVILQDWSLHVTHNARVSPGSRENHQFSGLMMTLGDGDEAVYG